MFHVQRRVEFADTDMAGIAHFSNFFRFMEAAEHAYLRACGLNVYTTWEGETVTFPRVSASCDYERPVRFEDVLDVEVGVEKVGRTSVRYGFLFSHRGERVAQGQITTVLCRVREGHGLEAMEVPPSMRERLLAGPARAEGGS
jgi:YbgC/YbaW family acyl-CoA thioester hydrolase